MLQSQYHAALAMLRECIEHCPEHLWYDEQPTSALPLIPNPYSKEDVLAYWTVCDGLVDAAVDRLDLLSTESGFSRYPIPKLEHQRVNPRHLQHHTAQLADRLRGSQNLGIRWIGHLRSSMST